MALQRVLYYADGFSLARGYTFTRSGSVGAYRAQSGLLVHAAANELRRHWRDAETPTLLYEAPRENLLLRSQELDNASWTKSFATLTTDAALGPDGLRTLEKLVASDATNTRHMASQNVTVTADVPLTLSMFCRAAERAFAFLVVQDLGGGGSFLGYFDIATLASNTDVSGTASVLGSGVEDWGNGLVRCWVSGLLVSATSIVVRVGPGGSINNDAYAASGEGIYLGCVQLEVGQEPTSYIPTTSSTASRGAEVWRDDFPWNPDDIAAMGGATFYTDVYEGMVPDWVTEGPQNTRLLQVGASGNTTPRLFLIREAASGNYQFGHHNGVTQRTSAVSTGLSPEWGSRIQLAGHIYPNGSVQLFARKDGTTSVAGTLSASLGFLGDWSDDLIHFGGIGSVGRGVQQYRKIAVAGGLLSIDEMDSLKPGLVIGGYAIPLAVDSVREQRMPIGDEGGRTFDGSWRDLVRGYTASWQAATPPLALADAIKVEELLDGDDPVRVFGAAPRLADGTTPEVVTRVLGRELVQSGTERRYSVKFAMDQEAA